MDFGPTTIAKLLLPRTPMILKTAILNSLSLSSNSSKQDTTTEVTVAILKSVLKVRQSIGFIQHVKDPGVKGHMWISKVTFQAPLEMDVRDALLLAIKELGDGSETFEIPDVLPVEAEWTGYRHDIDQHLDITEEEKYNHMMAEVESDVTIFYLHGGGYAAMDPISHRGVTARLAKLTKGRCLSVRYRLAPQNPFPAGLLDALIAYLSLLSTTPAEKIVFAGDSAGGGLCLAMLLTFLSLHRIGVKTISFQGNKVPIHLPAGVTVNSPWCDISRSMPSNKKNEQYDYLVPTMDGIPDSPLPDRFWPTNPPRIHMYCESSVLMHPLASPLSASPDLWKGMPPAFICVGNEELEDDGTIVARRIYESGGSVLFYGYEGMPHCFCMIFPHSATGNDCFAMWAKFCTDAVEGTVIRSDTGRWTKPFQKASQFENIPFEKINILSDAEVDKILRTNKDFALQYEAKLVQDWNEEKSKPRL